MSPEQAWVGVQVFFGALGAVFGSFMNVCVARMPEDRSVAWPGSHCPHCGSPVRAWDNVPVFAWFWLRGRCRDCAEPISALYPTVEALFALLAVLLFRRVVPDLGALDLPHLLAYGWYFWLLFALVALTFIDLRHHIIPDEFSIYSVPVGVVGAALLGALGYDGAPSWQESVVGAAAGGGALALLSGAYYLLRGAEGMGIGDAKLLALLGAYFGFFPGTIYILVGAATLGSVVGAVVLLVQRQSFRTHIPFGPFLAAAAVAWLFFGEAVSRYLHLSW